MSTIKLKLNVTGDYPPFDYRLKGTDTWQEDPIFEVPALEGAGEYTVEVRDANDCVKEFTLSEPKLEIESIGGFTAPALDVHGGIVTNIPTQAQMDWGTGGGFPYDENDFAGTVDWSTLYKDVHDIVFPISFVGSFHFFRFHLRTQLGQTLSSDIKGILWVPAEIDISNSLYSDVGELDIVAPLEIDHQNSNNIFVKHQVGPKDTPQLQFTMEVDSMTAITPETIESNDVSHIYLEHSYTIS